MKRVSDLQKNYIEPLERAVENPGWVGCETISDFMERMWEKYPAMLPRTVLILFMPILFPIVFIGCLLIPEKKG